MKPSGKKIFLVIEGLSIESNLRREFASKFDIKYLRAFENPQPYLNSQNVACVIVFFKEESESLYKKIATIKRNYNSVPILSIVNKTITLETIRLFGALGVDKVMSVEAIDQIGDSICKLERPAKKSVQLETFGIPRVTESLIVNKALAIIERDYLTLMIVREVSNEIGICESTLSREFKRARLMNPKRILMLFKIEHATHLLLNPRLNINDISNLSGFSHVKRFIECFHRVYSCSPLTYKKHLSQSQLTGTSARNTELRQ